MKNKLIYVFFTVAALMCCFACTAFADFDISYEEYLKLPKAKSSYECFSVGDINGDGKVSSLDARTVLRISVDLEDINTVNFSQADVNQDNRITSADARYILRLSVKLDRFPEHSVVEQNLLSATCSEEGLSAKICINCMSVCSEKIIKKRKHVESSQWFEVNPVTCQNDGKYIKICTYEDCQAVCQEQTITKTKEHSGEWIYYPKKIHSTEGLCYYTIDKERYCAVCGAHESKTDSRKGEHSYEKKTIEPSCFKDGESYEICTHCENVKNETLLPQIGKHNTKSEVIPSTCTSAGEIKSFCNRCNEVFETVVLPIAEHDYDNSFKKQIKAETCTEDGVSSVSCINCGIQAEIAWPKATGHDAPDGWTQILAPTCTTEGAEEGYCVTCYETVTRPIAATGHTVDIWTNEKPATCQEEGIETGYCSVCGVSDIQRKTPKTDHNFDTSPVYVLKGYIACKESFKGYYKCTTTGCDERDYNDFTPVDCHYRLTVVSEATCTAPKKLAQCCEYCGNNLFPPYSSGDALGHDYAWETVDGVQIGKCKRPGCQHIKQQEETPKT